MQALKERIDEEIQATEDPKYVIFGRLLFGRSKQLTVGIGDESNNQSEQV